MPKLPPPPRSPQSSSGFSSALACTSCPSAVTTSAPTRLSQVRPHLAHEPADAAAEREPGDPGGRHQPAGHREPERLRLVVEVAPQATGLRDDPCERPGRPGSPFIGDRSRTTPPSRSRSRGCCARRRARPAGVPRCGRSRPPRMTSETPAQRTIERRPPVVGAVPDRPRLVVVLAGRGRPALRAGPRPARPAWLRRRSRCRCRSWSCRVSLTSAYCLVVVLDARSGDSTGP